MKNNLVFLRGEFTKTENPRKQESTLTGDHCSMYSILIYALVSGCPEIDRRLIFHIFSHI